MTGGVSRRVGSLSERLARLDRRRTPAAQRYAAAGRPGTRAGWREAEWLAVDLELTGLDPSVDHIIAVGAVPVSGGRVQLGSATYSLVATPRRSSTAAVLTHRLLSDDLAGAPSLGEVLESLLTQLTGRVPIFHHAVVESAFLAPRLGARGLRMPTAADTEVLGRQWLRLRDGSAPASVSLDGLARQLGHQAEPAHHALADSVSTAQAFVALASLLDRTRPQTVGTLLSASNQNSWR